MTDLEKLLIAILAAIGAILNAILIWLESGEPFNARKFLPQQYGQPWQGLRWGVRRIALLAEVNNIVTYVTSFLASMGLDAASKRLQALQGEPCARKLNLYLFLPNWALCIN